MITDELRVGICDDKEEDLERIRQTLQEALQTFHRPVRMHCRLFRDGEQMYQSSREELYHLFFLDIEMPDVDGFKLAERLSMDRPRARLIFVSGHESFVFDSQEYTPFWFVRKGMLEHDMQRALRKYFQVTAMERISYRLQDGLGFCEILLRDILYIECCGHTLTIFKTDGKSLKKYGSLKTMEEELAGHGFLRIHKSCLANQIYIEEVGKREVYLKNGRELEMGRDRRKAVREAMILYERERREY